MPSSHAGLLRFTCLAVSLLPLGSGCTEPNPNFGMDPTKQDLATATPPDFNTEVIPDLAMKPPDLSPPVLCGPMGGAPNGARACSNNLRQSGTCTGNKLAADRDCPTKTECQGGYCAVPPPIAGSTQGNLCNSESQCFTGPATYAQSCMPFVVNKVVQMYCAESIGAGAAGEPCKRALDCRSGFCLGTGTCHRACASNFECPLRNNIQLVCKSVTLTVEGISFVTNSCVYP